MPILETAVLKNPTVVQLAVLGCFPGSDWVQHRMLRNALTS